MAPSPLHPPPAVPHHDLAPGLQEQPQAMEVRPERCRSGARERTVGPHLEAVGSRAERDDPPGGVCPAIGEQLADLERDPGQVPGCAGRREERVDAGNDVGAVVGLEVPADPHLRVTAADPALLRAAEALGPCQRADRGDRAGVQAHPANDGQGDRGGRDPRARGAARVDVDLQPRSLADSVRVEDERLGLRPLARRQPHGHGDRDGGQEGQRGVPAHSRAPVSPGTC
jgi:hypothetical protein